MPLPSKAGPPSTNFGHHPQPTGGVTCTELYVQIDDVALAGERVLRAGGRLLDQQRPRDWGDDVAYFSDPDGNIIALACRRS